jgi:hypothetical protein
VLASTLVALVAAPIVAFAASGLPSSITMTPERAGPGTLVEVVGLDFPDGQAVVLQLTTTAGAVQLATTTAEDGGYFRQSLTLPAGIAPGFWELRATAASGAVAVHIFESTQGVAAPVPADVGAVTANPVTEDGSGLFDADLVVVLVLVLLIGVIGVAAAYVWQQMGRSEGQPGMPHGDDPIWSGAPSETR